jgi:predicted anti-sigma-YlaC factor YlaD
MTQTWDCAEARPSLGVYVLGAIDPAERGLVDAHLVTCRDCRDELAGMAGLPALLARVNPDEISRICADDTVHPMASDDHPPEELLGTVLGLAEARRRRNRWRYLSAAAAVVAIAGGLFAGLSSATSTTVTRTVVAGAGGTAPWETVAATNHATGATATVAYSKQLWGNAFQVLTDRIPVGTTCQLWVVHPDGTWTQVAAWTTARDEGKVWYGGSMASTAGSISKFVITAGKTTLLTATPT